MISPENRGTHLSIDEVALSQGKLYAFLSNKAGKGKKGTLSKDILRVTQRIPFESRKSNVVKLSSYSF
jgi:hypothetical protein